MKSDIAIHTDREKDKSDPGDVIWALEFLETEEYFTSRLSVKLSNKCLSF